MIDRRIDALRAIHRQRHHRGVVDVGIMRIGVLERPAAGAHIRPPRDPVAADVEHLLRLEPLQPLGDRAAAPRRRRSPAAHGRRARCPRSATRKAADRPRPHARPEASRSRGARSPAADDPADSPARRTSSRCSPSPDRSPPSPSSPLSRSTTQATAASIARCRVHFGEHRLARRAADCRRRGRTRTAPRSAAAPSAPAQASPAARGTVRRSGHSSDFSRSGLQCISTSSGTMTVRLQ